MTTLRTYTQNCGLAAALDVIGERWTLLIIRALLAGPARFGEIRAQLPGIGSNLLSERLKSLARRGVLEKRNGAQGRYALTERGEALRPVAQLLARWGRAFLPVSGGAYHPRWTMFNIEAAFMPERAQGIDAVIGVSVAGETFHLIIRHQTCRAVAGPAVAPDVSIRAGGPQLLGEGARLQIRGDAAVFDRLRPCFDL